jgi:hypothetical protein
MISTIITIAIIVIILYILFGSTLIDVLKGFILLLLFPLQLIGALWGFLIEAGLFVGVLWLVVTIFGLE